MVGAAGTVDPASDPGKSSPRVLVAFCGDIGAPAQRPAVVTRCRGSDGASDAVLEGLAKRAADAARGGNDNRTSRRNAGLSKLFVRGARPRTSRIVIGRLAVPQAHPHERRRGPQGATLARRAAST